MSQASSDQTSTLQKDFDVIVIGGGQAGIPLAQALQKKGKRVLLAERKHLGGSCVNFGCTPTKAAIASAQVAQMARRAAEYGVEVGEVRPDFAKVMERARRVAAESRQGLEQGMDQDGAPALVMGQARLTGRDGGRFTLDIGGEAYSAAEVVLNTGTRSVIPQLDGLDTVDTIHAGNWLDLNELPEHLLILGGGYIGLEMSQFYRRMGAQVTVLDSGEQVAGHEDPDVAQALQALLEKEGVEFRMGVKVQGVVRGGDRLALTLDEGEPVEGSHLFLAVGRRPNTDDLGLESVGAEVDGKGVMKVDERLSSTVQGLWVAGDIRGGPMFTHTAWDDFRILESQMVGDGGRTTERVVPYGVFTEPQLGRVGMTEGQARKAGHDVQVTKYEMKKNGKAKEVGATEGFIKLVIDKKDDLILGAAVLADEGAELVHSYIDIMNAGATAATIENALHIHPTLSEGVQSAVRSAESEMSGSEKK